MVIQAGGFGNGADLSDIKWVHPTPEGPVRARRVNVRLFLDNAELHEIVPFFEAYYSHVFYIVYDAFITAEINLRQKGSHKAQREELEFASPATEMAPVVL